MKINKKYIYFLFILSLLSLLVIPCHGDWPPFNKVESGPVTDWPPFPSKFITLPALVHEITQKITGYTQQCVNGQCQQVPIYEDVDFIIDPISYSDAARYLASGKLSPEDIKRCTNIMNKEDVKKIEDNMKKGIKQQWDVASCGMLCSTHGSKLYDVNEDGSVTLAKDQSKIAPETGYDVGGIKLFRRRR